MEQKNRWYRFKISLFNEKVQIRITLAGREAAAVRGGMLGMCGINTGKAEGVGR